MNATYECYTQPQADKFQLLLAQKQVNPERFQLLLESGLLADIFEPNAILTNRLSVREALGLGVLPSDLGFHVVDYSMSLEAMIAAGNYDWKNDDITAERFPVKGEGRVEFEDCIFDFGRDIASSEEGVKLILAADLQNPWQPAPIENLLAYGAKNPEEQRKNPIVGLGSVGGVLGGRRVPCLGKGGSWRGLGLGWWGRGWGSLYRFLAVRKKVSVPSGT